MFRNPFSSTTIGDENPIRTLGDYSKPSHEGYRNTIELPVGNNMVPLRSDTIRLVQNGCSFHALRSEDPNQHLKDFLKLVDSLDLDGENRERTRLRVRCRAQCHTQMADVDSPSRGVVLIWLLVECIGLLHQSVTSNRPTEYEVRKFCRESKVDHMSMMAFRRGSKHMGKSCTLDVSVFNFQGEVVYTTSLSMVCEVFCMREKNSIADRIAVALPSDTVKNPKLSVSPVLYARSYPNMDPECSNHVHGSIKTITIHSEKQSDSYDEKSKKNEEEEKDSPENIHVNPSTPPDLSVAFITEKVLKFNSFFESLGLVPQSSNTEVICTKGDDGKVMFIELIRKNDDSSEGETEDEGSTTTKGIKEMHSSVGNFTYIVDFMIVEDISSIIDPRLSQVVLRKPFMEISNMTHDPPKGIVRFTNGTDEVAYKMPRMIE
ncbi:hypothetical protein Tco_1154207 [Tanacetum coccineum]